MNSPTTAANAMLRNAPDPLVIRRPGTTVKTDEAGVDTDKVISRLPSTLMLRWSPPLPVTACMNCESWILKMASDGQFQDFDTGFDYATGGKIGNVLFDEESAIASLSILRFGQCRIFLTIDGSTVSRKFSESLR
jgi:hypothetical protein